jgi:hypothetical protein
MGFFYLALIPLNAATKTGATTIHNIFWILTSFVILFLTIWLLNKAFGPRHYTDKYTWYKISPCVEEAVVAGGKKISREVHGWLETEEQLNDNDGGSYNAKLRVCQRCGKKKWDS